MYTVLVSGTFQKQFSSLDPSLQKRIRAGLQTLIKDPLNPRAGVDIKPLIATNPRKYRLRIGTYRIVYTIDGDMVKVIEGFVRERGY